jgi:UDP-3-O-[3-hydroxymyristoyl] glucosamine N-acyltransferase
LAKVAAAAGCEISAAEFMVSGLASLEDARPDQISFLGTPRHAGLLERTNAGVVIVSPVFQSKVPDGSIALVSAAPIVAWARVAALFHPAPAIRAGVHPTACVARRDGR